MKFHTHPRRCALACFLLFAVLLPASAAARPSSARGETISVWHTFHDKEELALKTIVLAFNLDHKDQIRLVPMSHDGFTADVEKSLRAGRGPDLFIWAHDKVGEWMKSGLIAPLDNLLPPAARADYFENCLSALTVREKLYGLPFSFETLILYYNKALVPHPPVNTDELIRLGQGLTDRSQGRYGLVYERGNFYHHAMWFLGFGGRIFDAKGNFNVATQEMKRSLEFARDMATVHGLIPDTVDWKLQMKLFNAGNAAMLISGPWAHGGIDPRIDLGMAILPFITESQKWSAPFLGVKGVYVSARSPRKRAAFDAAAFLTSDYGGATMNILAGSLPANLKSYQNGAVASDRRTAVFKEQVLNAVPMPSDPAMKHVWKVMMTDPATMKPGCIDRVFLLNTSPDTACADASREFTRALQGIATPRSATYRGADHTGSAPQ
ncbi:MAG: extracellular solute-binding protein [Candidatus Hydrogenedentota bacterium]